MKKKYNDAEYPVYEIVVDDTDNTGIRLLSIVEDPAIEMKGVAFSMEFESYDDYPKQASENAKIALRWAEENGWGDCGTAVGKARANQLANGEPISRDTISRMAAFERHRQNSKRELGDGCGRLMWLAWGGDAGVEWAQRKLDQIDREKLSIKGFEFKAQEEKQIIMGPAMIPSKKILRRDEDGNPYYTMFKPETILKLVQKFNSSGSNRRINVDHSDKMVDAYIMENWIVEDKYYDKSRKYGFDVPVGTWMVAIKIEDKKFWENEVKELGKFGFSIEGIMGERALQYKKVLSIYEHIDNLTDDEVLELMFIVEPGASETKDEFISRCIEVEVGSGKEQDQAAAICYTKWEEKDKKFKKWRSDPSSASVKKMMYNDETFELVIEFNGGDKYTYFDVDFNVFKDIFQGNGVCRTEGSNKWGEWYVGKSPSVGAAVYQILEEGGYSYVRGGSLR
jgi:hypothetical protein